MRWAAGNDHYISGVSARGNHYTVTSSKVDGALRTLIWRGKILVTPIALDSVAESIEMVEILEGERA